MGWGGVIPGAPCRTLNVASTVKFFSVCFSTPGWLPRRRLGPSLGSTGARGGVGWREALFLSCLPDSA